MTLADATKRLRRRLGPGLFALAVATALHAAGGEAQADPTPSDKATAQALFDDAQTLIKSKRYADACPKLAESLRLDPALGTKLYLADCYEKNGQTASAWVLFREAAEQARIAGQAERMKKANDRVAALALRLCRLRVDVAVEAEVTGVEVKRDGTVLGPASWGTSVPLNPGEHVIEAEAPGKKRWSTKVTLKDGETVPVAVMVPTLEDLPKPPPPPVPEPPKVEPPKVEPPPAPPKVEPPPAPPKVEPALAPPKPRAASPATQDAPGRASGERGSAQGDRVHAHHARRHRHRRRRHPRHGGPGQEQRRRAQLQEQQRLQRRGRRRSLRARSASPTSPASCSSPAAASSSPGSSP